MGPHDRKTTAGLPEGMPLATPKPVMDNGDLIRRLSKRRVEVTVHLHTLTRRLNHARSARDLETQGTVPYLVRGIASLQASVTSLTRKIDAEHQHSKLSTSSGS